MRKGSSTSTTTAAKPVEIPEPLVKAEGAATRAYLDAVLMGRGRTPRRATYRAMRRSMDASEAARVAARTARATG